MQPRHIDDKQDRGVHSIIASTRVLWPRAILCNVVKAQLTGPDYLTATHIKQYLISAVYRVGNSIVTNDALAMGHGVDRDLSWPNQ